MNNRPKTLAEVAERLKSGEDFSVLLPEFLDTFYGALADGRAQELIDQEPRALDDPIEHALLGATGEHLARRWKLSTPAWSNDPTRFLASPHFTTPLEGLKALLLVASPLAFRRRLIFTEAEPLRRARMPVAIPAHGPVRQTADGVAYRQPILALKWVGFDLDDTLHFYRKASGHACEAVFDYLDEEFGCGASELEAAYAGILKDAQMGAFADGRSARDCRAERFGTLLAAFSIISYRHLEAVLDLYDEALSKNLELKEGAKETLLAARANGLRIMIVSEGPHDAQESTLERLGISPLVDLLVTSAAEKTSKRSGLLKIALGRAHCAAQELIYVGDSLAHDIGPAHEAGVPAIYVGEEPAPAGVVKMPSLLNLELVLNAVAQGTWAGRPKQAR